MHDPSKQHLQLATRDYQPKHLMCIHRTTGISSIFVLNSVPATVSFNVLVLQRKQIYRGDKKKPFPSSADWNFKRDKAEHQHKTESFQICCFSCCVIHLGPFTSEVRHALSRISDHLLGLIPNFSNITQTFLCAGRGMRILCFKPKGKKCLQHHVGITTVRFRPPGLNNYHISSPQKKKEPGLMLKLLCLRPGDELGLPQATQTGHSRAEQRMLSPITLCSVTRAELP